MSQQMPAPNRMAQMQFKAKKVGALKGHKLLKQKRDALKARFQQMLREIIECKIAVGNVMNECFFTMAKAKYASPSDITAQVIGSVKKPGITHKLTADNVAGVFLPKFIMQKDETKLQSMESLGIGMGGAVLQACRDAHITALTLLTKMASLQTSFITLDQEIKMTSRRVSALEFVVIPRIEAIIEYIKQAMDEMEREEFFRVKKVVEKKKQKIERQKLEDAMERAEKAGGAVGQTPSKSRGGFATAGFQATALGQKDPDLLF